MARSTRAAAPAALFLATVLACTGGLLLNAGNAYPCDFSQDDSVRDQACPPGWVCGVTDHCQQFAEEGLPDGAIRPQLNAGVLIAPRTLDAGIVALARDPDGGHLVAALAGGRAAEVTYVGQLPAVHEATASGSYSQGALWGDTLVLLLDGGTAQLGTVGVGGPPQTIDAGAGSVVRGLRAFPGRPPPPLQLLFTKAVPTGLNTAHYSVEDGSFRDMPSVGFALLDARPLPSPLLGLTSASQPFTSVALMVANTDLLRRPQLYYRTPEPGIWTALEDGAAPAVFLPLTGRGRLRHSANGEVWAAVMSDASLAFDVLAVWQLGFGNGQPQVSRVWKDCTPCKGQVRVFQPIFSGGPAVELICEGVDAISRTAVVVQSSSAAQPTDACDTVPLTPPFNLAELASSDDVMAGQVALGGASGQLWAGDRLSTVFPLFLDRVPDAIGTAKLTSLGGNSVGLSLPFASSFYAVGAPGNDFPAFASTKDGVPRAPISGAANWLVTDGARIILLNPIVTVSATPFDLRYGPRLLNANGDPAAGPYSGASAGADAGTFVVSAADSIYVYPLSALRLVPFINPGEDLIPQLTPQAGSPIRSLALDPLAPGEDLDAGIHGYAISGNALYRFSRDGTPEHWQATRIDLSSAEPVETWAVDDGRKLGRVGFRDGSVFTLPGGLPMVDPLPADANGKSNRVFDFDTVNGWPVCFAERGLYLSQRVTGQHTLVWEHLDLPGDLALVISRSQSGRLGRGPDGTLLLYLDRGRVYAFSIAPVTP